MLHSCDCVGEGIRIGVEVPWVVRVLGDAWSSWSPTEICSALAATGETGVEESTPSAETGMTWSSAVRREASAIRAWGHLSRRNGSQYDKVLGAWRSEVLMRSRNFGGSLQFPFHHKATSCRSPRSGPTRVW